MSKVTGNNAATLGGCLGKIGKGGGEEGKTNF